MYGESKGYSLTVLIITIAVILIITTTAVMSIKNVGKDRDVARFMSDLQEVKQYVIDYMAVDNTLPVKYDNYGLMISAELELISKFSGEGEPVPKVFLQISIISFSSLLISEPSACFSIFISFL